MFLFYDSNKFPRRKMHTEFEFQFHSNVINLVVNTGVYTGQLTIIILLSEMLMNTRRAVRTKSQLYRVANRATC